jgi:hypothetical protein
METEFYSEFIPNLGGDNSLSRECIYKREMAGTLTTAFRPEYSLRFGSSCEGQIEELLG